MVTTCSELALSEVALSEVALSEVAPQRLHYLRLHYPRTKQTTDRHTYIHKDSEQIKKETHTERKADVRYTQQTKAHNTITQKEMHT